MTLDFQITHFYRLVVDDLILMSDAYSLYRKYKTRGRTLDEYLHILSIIAEIEAQELEDAESGKVINEESDESVSYLAWDYFRSVILRFAMDDLSQFAFWSSKILLSLENEPFGMPTVRKFYEHLYNNVRTGNIRILYEGAIPYLTASFVVNFPHILRATKKFFFTVLTKLPRPPSFIHLPGDESSNQRSNALATSVPGERPKPPRFAEGDISPATGENEHSLQKKISMYQKKNSPENDDALSHSHNNKSQSLSTTSIIQRFLETTAITTLSQPFLVIAVRMVKHQLGAGKSWLYAYLQLLTNEGLPYLYTALRSRLIYNLLPISSFYFFGIPDSIIYRRIIGQSVFSSTEQMLNVARQLAAQDNSQSALSLMNYGVLTMSHFIPGFVSFLGMRSIGWLLFGPTIHRRHQVQRRSEIVDAYLQKLRQQRQAAKKML